MATILNTAIEARPTPIPCAPLPRTNTAICVADPAISSPMVNTAMPVSSGLRGPTRSHHWPATPRPTRFMTKKAL